MSRQPWDELGGKSKKRPEPPVPVPVVEVPASPVADEEASKVKIEILQNRLAFGAITGGLTGASFGFFDAARKTKFKQLGSATLNNAGISIAKYTGVFSGFYATYQVSKRALQLYAPAPYSENGMLIASCLTLSPFIAVSSIRPLVPYAVVLIGLDVWHTLTSDDK